MRAVLLGFVERYPLVQLHAGRGNLPKVEHSGPKHRVCFYEYHGVLSALSQAPKLLHQLTRRL